MDFLRTTEKNGTMHKNAYLPRDHGSTLTGLNNWHYVTYELNLNHPKTFNHYWV